MTKSQLIKRISSGNTNIQIKLINSAVKKMLENMTAALITGNRIEIRGFGSFSLRYRAMRMGRNPKTGAPVFLKEKNVLYFKPGKELRNRVNR